MQRFKRIIPIRKFTTNSAPNFINCNKEWSTKKCNRELMSYLNSEIYNKSNKLMEMTALNELTRGMAIGTFISLMINTSFFISIIPSTLIFAIGYNDTAELKKELFEANSKRDQLYCSYSCVKCDKCDNCDNCDNCDDCSKNKNN